VSFLSLAAVSLFTFAGMQYDLDFLSHREQPKTFMDLLTGEEPPTPPPSQVPSDCPSSALIPPPPPPLPSLPPFPWERPVEESTPAKPPPASASSASRAVLSQGLPQSQDLFEEEVFPPAQPLRSGSSRPQGHEVQLLSASSGKDLQTFTQLRPKDGAALPQGPLPQPLAHPSKVSERPARAFSKRKRNKPVRLNTEDTMYVINNDIDLDPNTTYVVDDPPTHAVTAESGVAALPSTIPETPHSSHSPASKQAAVTPSPPPSPSIGEVDPLQESFLITPAKDLLTEDMQVPWKDLAQHLSKKCKAVMKVRGDGFCFLHAVHYSLWGNYAIKWSVPQMCERVMNFILENSERLSGFASSEEELVRECVEFFCDKKYYQKSVDIIIYATAEALQVQLDIYMQQYDRVHLHHVRPPNSKTRVLPIVYTGNPNHPLFAHYDAVVPMNWLQFDSEHQVKGEQLQSKERMRRWCETKMPSTSTLFRPSSPIPHDMTASNLYLQRQIDKCPPIDTRPLMVIQAEESSSVTRKNKGGPFKSSTKSTATDAQRTAGETAARTARVDKVEEPCDTEPSVTAPSETAARDGLRDTAAATPPAVEEEPLGNTASDSMDDEQEDHIYAQFLQDLEDMTAIPETPLPETAVQVTADGLEGGDQDGRITPVSSTADSQEDGRDPSDSDCFIDETMSSFPDSFPERDISIISEPAIDNEKILAETELGLRDNLPSCLLPAWLLKSDVFRNPTMRGGTLNIPLETTVKLILAGQPLELADMHIHPEVVPRIPKRINGNKLYIIPNCAPTWAYDTRDCWHFVMNTSSRQELIGVRKTGLCQGHWRCINENCPYYLQNIQKQVNKQNIKEWKRGSKRKRCLYCHALARESECGTQKGRHVRKVIEYHEIQKYAVVWHYGQHSCEPKEDIPGHKAQIARRIRENPKSTAISAEQYGIDQITARLLAGDIAGANKEICTFADPELTRRVMKENVAPALMDNTSWDALANFKVTTDKEDVFLIYRINNKNMITGSRDFVFKSSATAARIALDMDIHTGRLKTPYECTAFFDVKHRRSVGFKSIALWKYHVGIKHTYRLAIMDIRGEKTEDLIIFFRLFNSMLQDFTKDPSTTFRPHLFMSDHAGANFNAIKTVYGQDVLENRFVGCGFHFLQDAKKRLHLIPHEDRDEFIRICHGLLKSHESITFDRFMDNLGQFVSNHPTLTSWASWWVARQCHTFGPYRDPGTTYANLAEAGNASLNFKGPAQALLDITARDVATQKMMDKRVVLWECQKTAATGRGPSFQSLLARDRAGQMRRSQQYAANYKEAASRSLQDDIFPPSDFQVNPSAKHRPPLHEETFPIEGRSVPREETGETAECGSFGGRGATSAGSTPRGRGRVRARGSRGRGSSGPSPAGKGGRGRARASPRGKGPARGGRGGRGRGRGNMPVAGPGTSGNDETAAESSEPHRQDNAVPGVSSEEDIPSPAISPENLDPNVPAIDPSSRRTAANLGMTFVTLSRAETERIIAVGEEVLGRAVPVLNTPRWKQHARANPPMLTFLDAVYHTTKNCAGCRKKLDLKTARPLDMCINLLGEYKTPAGKVVPRNCHFHLDWRCIKKYQPSLEPLEVTCDFSTFSKLTRDRMEVLDAKGLLEPLLADKKYH